MWSREAFTLFQICILFGLSTADMLTLNKMTKSAPSNDNDKIDDRGNKFFVPHGEKLVDEEEFLALQGTDKTTTFSPLPVPDEVITNMKNPSLTMKRNSTKMTIYKGCSVVDGPDKGKDCVFPFIYQGVRHDACVLLGQESVGYPWCATNTLPDGTMTPARFGHCSAYCPIELPFCKTTSGPVMNALCRFPFRYKGIEFWSCTTFSDPEDRPWCATAVDGHGDFLRENWGYCAPDCPRPLCTETMQFPDCLKRTTPAGPSSTTESDSGESTTDSSGTTTDSNGETTTDSNGLGETTTDSNGVGETTTDSNGVGETTTDSNGVGETTTDSNGIGETTTDTNGSGETTTMESTTFGGGFNFSGGGGGGGGSTTPMSTMDTTTFTTMEMGGMMGGETTTTDAIVTSESTTPMETTSTTETTSTEQTTTESTTTESTTEPITTTTEETTTESTTEPITTTTEETTTLTTSIPTSTSTSTSTSPPTTTTITTTITTTPTSTSTSTTTTTTTTSTSTTTTPTTTSTTTTTTPTTTSSSTMTPEVPLPPMCVPLEHMPEMGVPIYIPKNHPDPMYKVIGWVF